MTFLEYRTWKRSSDVSCSVYDKNVVAWLSYVKENKETLFPALMSIKYFRQCDEEGVWNGTYVMLFEHESLAGYEAQKDLLLLSCPPLHAGGSDATILPPWHYAAQGSLRSEYLEPQHKTVWFDYTAEIAAQELASGITNTRYLEYEYWQLAEDADWGAYEEIIDVWFRYVAEHKSRLFGEWLSARYYRITDAEMEPTGRYAMVFEYVSHPDFQTYKKRRRHSYDTNTGDYLVYRDNDPYQFFNESTVGTDGLWPEKSEHWI